MRRVEKSAKLDLERIIFIGRTFEEYVDMFSLSLDKLYGKRILDCPAGACSFTAEGNKQGLDVTAGDIVYSFPINKLKEKGLQDIQHAMQHMEGAQDNYLWNYFKNIEALRVHRLRALNECVDDMVATSGRYRPVVLPALPFEDNEFDLILSAHFLFMYADRLDDQFHLQTINELVRVAREEIRIFPLVDLEGKRYRHLGAIINHLTNIGCSVEEIPVQYEFQSNANSMLKIKI